MTRPLSLQLARRAVAVAGMRPDLSDHLPLAEIGAGRIWRHLADAPFDRTEAAEQALELGGQDRGAPEIGAVAVAALEGIEPRQCLRAVALEQIGPQLRLPARLQ